MNVCVCARYVRAHGRDHRRHSSMSLLSSADSLPNYSGDMGTPQLSSPPVHISMHATYPFADFFQRWRHPRRSLHQHQHVERFDLDGRDYDDDSSGEGSLTMHDGKETGWDVMTASEEGNQEEELFRSQETAPLSSRYLRRDEDS